MKNNWKKRLLAALLTAIFVVTLLPMGAFAYGPFDSVPLNLRISSYGAPFWNPNEQSHSVNPLNWTKYIRRDAVGSNNANGSARAYFQGSNENGWQLYLDVKIGNYTETFPINAYVHNKDMSQASGNVTFGFSFNTQGGTSSYISISGAKDFPAPDKPSNSTVESLLRNNAVKIDCTNSTASHPDQTYGLITGSYSVGNVQGSNGNYTVSVTVTPSLYVMKYNADTDVSHSLDPAGQSNQSIALSYNGSNWAVSGTVPVTYTVKCQTLTQKYPVLYDGNEPPAAAAGAQNIPEDTNTYEVDADVPVSTQEPALDGYDFLGWAQSPSGDVVTGTVKMVEGGLTFYARWREAGGQPGEAPKPPSAEEIARQLEVVTLYCETKPEEHPQEHYETKADSIEVDEPRQGADDVWTVTARVYAGSYVDDYNANIAPGHNPTRTYQTITLTWFQTGDDPEGTWDVTGGSPVSFTLKCDGTGPDDPEPSHSTGSSGGGAPDRFYTIVSSADEGGRIVREGVQKIREATDRRFSIYPDEGWEIDEVLVDGRPAKLEEDDKYWFREVRRDHTIHVSFRQIVPAQAPEAKPVPSTGAI